MQVIAVIMSVGTKKGEPKKSKGWETINLVRLGPYSVIISFSSSYYNDYDAGGRVLPLDHY